MPQKEIAELFDTTKQTISYHMATYSKKENWPRRAVVKEILTTASDGKNYRVGFYNLDAIIAVGYRSLEASNEVSPVGVRNAEGIQLQRASCLMTTC